MTNREIFTERIQLTVTDPEYQYHLKDHLGNVRVTFTGKDDTDRGNSGTSGWPKGWLNMLVFDKDYNLVDIAASNLTQLTCNPSAIQTDSRCRS